MAKREIGGNALTATSAGRDDSEEERMSWQEDYADDPDDESMGDDFEDLEDGDSGMVGSMMDAVLAHYEKGKCRQCDKSMEEKPAAESFCSQDCKEKWETLLKVRVEIGLHDLKTRGYD